jgi:UDP-N-acetylmuramoyl-tripeptide--D-alanyl-D-alanine ligase
MKVSIDTRTIKSGDYFIPVKGQNFDGREFIAEAISKGATLLDVDLFSHAKKYRKKLTCKVIGIVGSAGKTTVKDMLYSVLNKQYAVVKTKENQNNEIGVALTLLAADADTEFLLVEMGMRNKNDLTDLAKLVQPDYLIFTGVGKSHIGLHKTFKDLAKAKSEIFRRRLGWQVNQRYCFINCNGSFNELIQTKAIKTGYKLISSTGEDKVSENINLVYSAGSFFGVSNEIIEAGLKLFKSSSHRMKLYYVSKVTLLDDTYNSNPEGVLYALQYLRRFSGRKICVFGDMLELGDCAESEHLKILNYIQDEGIDVVFLFGKYTEAISNKLDFIYHFKDIDVLSSQLKDELKKGDVVLIKGSRAMKMERIVTYLKDGNN